MLSSEVKMIFLTGLPGKKSIKRFSSPEYIRTYLYMRVYKRVRMFVHARLRVHVCIGDKFVVKPLLISLETSISMFIHTKKNMFKSFSGMITSIRCTDKSAQDLCLLAYHIFHPVIPLFLLEPDSNWS